MKTIILGVGDIAVSNRPGVVLKTYGLGSCVAVIIVDRKARSAGMAHIALPDSAMIAGPEKNEKPGRFADTGIHALVRKMDKFNNGNPNHYQVKIVGGANVLDIRNILRIGEKNILAVKKALWKYRIKVTAEDTGGKIARTVFVSVATGETMVVVAGKAENRL
ncbi:MAG: chemotaxis protein CheD [Desulfobulbaceae bacterium]|nr:chemotaxis protein CheD [Desulfobulbaceae bacterium]